jgi:hypothetical protein
MSSLNHYLKSFAYTRPSTALVYVLWVEKVIHA